MQFDVYLNGYYHVSLFQHFDFLTWTLQQYRMISELKAMCNDTGKPLEDIIEREEELRWCDARQTKNSRDGNQFATIPKTFTAQVENVLRSTFEMQEALLRGNQFCSRTVDAGCIREGKIG